jgi:hypothetical protein
MVAQPYWSLAGRRELDRLEIWIATFIHANVNIRPQGAS